MFQKASWTAVRLPSSASPSMVVISAPSACTAKAVHDFTVTPFILTTQAPHWLVSQPILVPVRFRVSRRKCTSRVRGSTSAEWERPFTLTVMGTVLGKITPPLYRTLRPQWDAA